MSDVVEALRRMKKNLGMHERSGTRGRPVGISDSIDQKVPAFRDWASESGVAELPDINVEAIRLRRLPWSTASFPDLPRLNERLSENGMSIRAALRFPAGLLDLAGIPDELITISNDVPVETIKLILKKAGHWPDPEEGAPRSRGMPTEDLVPEMALALERAGGEFRFIVDGPGELTRVSDRIETVRKALHFGGHSPLVENPSSELLHELQKPGLRKTKRLTDAELMRAFGEDPESLTGGSGDTDAASIRKLVLALERIGMDIRIAIPDPAFGWIVADRLNRASTFSRLAVSLGGRNRTAVEKALDDPGRFGLKEIRKAFTSAGVGIRFVLCGPEKGREEVFDGGTIVTERTLRIINRRDWERRRAAGDLSEKEASEPDSNDPEDPDDDLFESGDQAVPDRDDAPDP